MPVQFSYPAVDHRPDTAPGIEAALATLLHAVPPAAPGEILADLLSRLAPAVPSARCVRLTVCCGGGRRPDVVVDFPSGPPADRPPELLTAPLPGAAGLGHIDFYADAPFPPGSAEAAAGAAALCSLVVAALAERLRAENLELALLSSRQIAAAVGIVMAQQRCPYDEAFGLLKAASQRGHRKMRELADDILFTGEVPALGPDGTAGGRVDHRDGPEGAQREPAPPRDQEGPSAR
jgi:hypothetical protein